MSTVLIVILVVLVLLAVGGAIATARRTREHAGAVHAQVREAEAALVEAHAADKGWDRAELEAAARAALEGRGEEVRGLRLVQVLDRPGAQADEAVFRAEVAGGEREVVLGRDADGWTEVAAGR